MLQHYPQKEKSARTLIWITPCKAIAAARGKENRHQPMNSVGVQHLSFMLRLSQKEKNLTARGTKGFRKERNVFILRHLFFATFAKNLCVFALNLYKYLCEEKKEFVLSKQVLRCGYITNTEFESINANAIELIKMITTSIKTAKSKINH